MAELHPESQPLCGLEESKTESEFDREAGKWSWRQEGGGDGGRGGTGEGWVGREKEELPAEVRK